MSTTQPPHPRPAPKRENLFLNLGMNILLPVVLLNKGGDWLGVSPQLVLITALAFPLGYGIFDYVTRKKTNLFSIIGFISTLLTGGIGLLQLDTRWLAAKEAGIPAVFALLTALSAASKKPLIRLFILNPDVMDVEKIEHAIPDDKARKIFDQILRRGTWYLAASFVVSAILNYFLTILIVTSAPGTEAYNADLGRLQWVSYIVIAAPTFLMLGYTLYYVLSGIKKITGLGIEDLVYHDAEADNTKGH